MSPFCLAFQLRVGNYERYLGNLLYHAWYQSIVFIGIMIGLGVILLIAIIILCVRCYRRRGDPHYLGKSGPFNPNQYVGGRIYHVLKSSFV